MPLWLEQYNRTHRWKERLRLLVFGIARQDTLEHEFDDIHAFFVNAYNLKDWIKNDPRVPTKARSRVEAYIRESEPLALCGDIANSIKHLKLTNSKTGEEPCFQPVPRTEHRYSRDPDLGIVTLYQLDVGEEIVDVWQLAVDIMLAWTNFLIQEGLLMVGPPRP